MALAPRMRVARMSPRAVVSRAMRSTCPRMSFVLSVLILGRVETSSDIRMRVATEGGAAV